MYGNATNQELDVLGIVSGVQNVILSSSPENEGSTRMADITIRISDKAVKGGWHTLSHRRGEVFRCSGCRTLAAGEGAGLDADGTHNPRAGAPPGPLACTERSECAVRACQRQDRRDLPPRAPLSLHLHYRNHCAIISRALISSPQDGYMVNAARASVNRATARFILRSRCAGSKGSSTTSPSPRRVKISHHVLVSVLPAILNRHKMQLESSVTYRKQTTAPNSNRHKYCPKPVPALRAPAVTTYESPLTPFLFDTNKTHRIIILTRAL